MTIRELNETKKMLKCLKCGKRFLTDRCHRICARCKKALFRYRDSVRPVFICSANLEELVEEKSLRVWQR